MPDNLADPMNQSTVDRVPINIQLYQYLREEILPTLIPGVPFDKQIEEYSGVPFDKQKEECPGLLGSKEGRQYKICQMVTVTCHLATCHHYLRILLTTTV
jgi:hypothetical protein